MQKVPIDINAHLLKVNDVVLNCTKELSKVIQMRYCKYILHDISFAIPLNPLEIDKCNQLYLTFLPK